MKQELSLSVDTHKNQTELGPSLNQANERKQLVASTNDSPRELTSIGRANRSPSAVTQPRSEPSTVFRDVDS